MSDEGAIGTAIGDAYPRVLARVLAAVRRLDIAEDAVHDAIERALIRWPEAGVPESIEGWLVATALNRWRDGLRHQRRVERHEETVSLTTAPRVDADAWSDELLRLVVTACDPVLSTADAAALALATAVGMTTAEIAGAFLVEERTMEQRLVRARRAVRESGREYVVPGEAVALERLEPVMAALYLLFNEGYWSASGAPVMRGELCALAIGLARSLVLIAPEEPELDALVALMWLHDARGAARLSPEGTPIPLPEQDRSLWNRTQIERARALLRRREPVVRTARRWEAEIALEHATALSADATDWTAISDHYERLERLRPGGPVRINRAFAVARAHGPAEGLALLGAVDDRSPHAAFVRAVLLSEQGDLEGARAAFERARAVSHHPHERVEIDRRLASLGRRARPGTLD